MKQFKSICKRKDVEPKSMFGLYALCQFIAKIVTVKVITISMLGGLCAQSYSVTHDIAGGIGDVYKTMVVEEDTIYAVSAHGCNGEECMAVVKMAEDGSVLISRTFTWMDDGDRDVILKDGGNIVVCGDRGYGSGIAGLNILVLDTSLDSLSHGVFSVPDSIVSVAVRSIVSFMEYYIVVGFAAIEERPYPALMFWVNKDDLTLDTMIMAQFGDDLSLYTQVFVADSHIVVSFYADTENNILVRRGFHKYNMSKQIVWNWSSELESYGARGEDAVVLSNGNMVIEHAVDNRFQEFRLICISPEGEVLWTYDDPDHPFGQKYLFHLSEAENGDILGCGELDWPWDPNETNPTEWNGYYGAYVFRLDATTGFLRWERAIIGYDSLWNYSGDYFTDIDELSDGSLIMCGGWRIYDSTQLVSFDSWLVRTDDEGCVISDCNFTSFTTATNEPGAPLTRSMRIFPNPSRDQVQIVLPQVNPWSEDITYLVHSTSGQQMISTGSSVIDLSALPTGVYQITAVGRRGRVIQTGKVVKVD